MGACQKVFCVRVGFWVRVIFTLEVTVHHGPRALARLDDPKRVFGAADPLYVALTIYMRRGNVAH